MRAAGAFPETVFVPGGRLESEIVSFEMGRTPVTNREYSPFLEATGAEPPPWWNDPDFRSPLQPVVGVTWDEASAYCEWLVRAAGGRWRLPTEAEWEFAACGGLVAPKTAWGEAVPSGEVPEGPLAGPWEVGRGTPNGYGLFDMGTIVHEWCAGWRELAVTAATSAIRRRASRGGSWRHRIRWSSPSAKSSLPPDYRYSDYGFRVVRETQESAVDLSASFQRSASRQRRGTGARAGERAPASAPGRSRGR